MANLSPNMIYFDAVDFSECRYEEVISFFWFSVYDSKSRNNNYFSNSIPCGPMVRKKFTFLQYKSVKKCIQPPCKPV